MRNRGREFARRERQRQITAEVAAETNTLKVKRLLAEAPPLFNKQVESFKAWLEGYNEVQPDDPQKRMSFSTLSPDSFRITKGLNNERIELIVCFHPNNAYFTCVSNPRGYGAVFCYDLDSDGKVTLYSGGKAMDCDTASDAVLRAFISRLWQSGD